MVSHLIKLNNGLLNNEMGRAAVVHTQNIVTTRQCKTIKIHLTLSTPTSCSPLQ